jgi:hypothetical protein
MGPNGLWKTLKKSTVIVKEGFQQISEVANAASIDYNMESDNKNSWTQKALTYASDMGYDTVLSKHANYKSTPIPLEGTMNFFKNTEFKPECCPSSFSSSSGCACTSVDQLNYLNQRGGNRIGVTEF